MEREEFGMREEEKFIILVRKFQYLKLMGDKMEMEVSQRLGERARVILFAPKVEIH